MDILKVLVNGDLLATFVNMFTVVIKKLKLIFMFNELTMQEDQEKAKKFCRTIIEPIIGKKIRNLELIPQKYQQGATPRNHGIQMDAYIRTFTDLNGEEQQDVEVRVESAIYDLEPNKYQNESREELRRARYYHSLIDKSIFKSGQLYSKLEKVVVIFILPYDPFGYDRMMYTVKRHCVEEPDMPYDDGDLTYFLYAYGTKEIPSQELKDMLLFLVDSSEENAQNEDLRAVRAMMDEIKQNSEVEVKHMIAAEHERDILACGIEQETLRLLQAKLAKGKDIATIADELEATEEEILALIKKYQLEFYS